MKPAPVSLHLVFVYKGENKMKERLKTIVKYAVNTLAIINALLVGLDPIWNIPYADKTTATIAVIMAVMSTYLLGNKAKAVSIQKKEK